MSALIVFELEQSGFTHLVCECARCQRSTALTFKDVRDRVQASVWAMTTEELAAYLGCNKCGQKPTVTVEKRQRDRRGGPRLVAKRA